MRMFTSITARILAVILGYLTAQHVSANDGAALALNSHFVQNGDQRIHYMRAGEHQDAIVFLHGFPLFWRAWLPQLQHFSATHTVVALDGRGYNLSSAPAAIEAYRLNELVSDVRTVLESLGVSGRITLVGHDWGGALAWAYAQAFPETIDHLVVANAPPVDLLVRYLTDDEDQRRASAYIGRLQAEGSEVRLAADNYRALRGLFEGAGYFTGEEVDRYIAAWSRPGRLRGQVNWYRANLSLPVSHSASETLEKIELPTLVIWGVDDPVFVPSLPAEMGAYARNLTVKRLSGVGHTPNLEAPSVFNAELARFIASQTAPKSAVSD